MPKDVIVVVDLQEKPKPAEALDILILSTHGGNKDIKTYRSLDEIAVDYPSTTIVYKKAAALFNQGKTTLAGSLISKVKIASVEITGAADAEMAADLVTQIEALRDKNDDWYILLTDRDGDAYAKALCAWAESTEPTEAELEAGEEDYRKFYFGQVNSLDLGITNRRAALIYSADFAEQADAAYVGNVGPFYPRKTSWKFKRPAGISLPSLTFAEREQLEENNINFLTDEYKRVYVKNGVCTDGEYIASQLGADYIAINMREQLYDTFLVNADIDYSDTGFAIVVSAVFAALSDATALGIIAKDPESSAGLYNVKIPRRIDATPEQAAAGQMPDIVWEAEIGKSVHRVRVTGRLSVTLGA